MYVFKEKEWNYYPQYSFTSVFMHDYYIREKGLTSIDHLIFPSSKPTQCHSYILLSKNFDPEEIIWIFPTCWVINGVTWFIHAYHPVTIARIEMGLPTLILRASWCSQVGLHRLWCPCVIIRLINILSLRVRIIHLVISAFSPLPPVLPDPRPSWLTREIIYLVREIYFEREKFI